MPRVEEVEVRIGRRDVAEAQVVAELQRRGELHAARDRMIEPDLDQALADGERDEALRRLARDAELARDLVLRVAGDVIEPAGARRFVEPQTLLIRPARHQFPFPAPGGSAQYVATISGSRAMSSKMRSAPAAVNSAAWAGPEKWLPPTKPNTVMPAARAAVTPATLSSMTRQSSGAAPIERAANRKRSGCGLPRGTSADEKMFGANRVS